MSIQTTDKQVTALTPARFKELLAENHQVRTENVQLKTELAWLKEQIALARHRQFGAKSEHSPLGQEPMLFDEAEVLASTVLPDPETEVITYERTKKSVGQRQHDLAGMPTEEIVYSLPEEEQVCPQCAGPLHEMGADERVELKVIPAVLTAVRHLRTKYACRHCQQHEIKTPIITAPMPTPAFPNSLASASSVAYIMSQKFVEGLPLYRQEAGFHRLGYKLSRQTMANWMMVGAGWLEHAYRRMHEHLLTQPILHADETALQVLKEDGRPAASKSYMWLYRTGRAGPPIVLFDYQRTRAREHPTRFLHGFAGYLHVDGYAGYDKLADITVCGCWAHARRKFVEALATVPANERKKADIPAAIGLAFCNKLFAIEADLLEATPEERLSARLAKSRPVLDALLGWLDKMAQAALPQPALGQAISYCRSQWPKLTRFLLDGRLEIDNNRSERSIKPFVIGRKNWLFANTARGARSSAVIYSLVETAKENGLDPRRYLAHLFEQLPNIDCKDAAALDALLPWSASIQASFRVPSRSKP